MARIYVGGVGGCGKTTVGRTLASKIPGMAFVTGSEIMMQAAGVNSREELESLPEAVKQNLRATAFEGHYKANPNLVTEGHFYLTAEDVQCFDAFILIEVEIKDLINLRESDRSRKRSVNLDDISQESKAINERISSLERNYGIRVISIKNDGSMENLVRKIEGVYDDCISGETRRELTSNPRKEYK